MAVLPLPHRHAWSLMALYTAIPIVIPASLTFTLYHICRRLLQPPDQRLSYLHTAKLYNAGGATRLLIHCPSVLPASSPYKHFPSHPNLRPLVKARRGCGTRACSLLHSPSRTTASS